jgi:hypothetical protein
VSVNLIELQQAVEYLGPIARHGKIFNHRGGVGISLPKTMTGRSNEDESNFRREAVYAAMTILQATETLLPELLAKQEAASCA